MEEEILEFIIETAVEEVMHCILKSKCCAWSKRKWNRVMRAFGDTQEERRDRIRNNISNKSTRDKQDIKNYAIRLTSI